MSTVIKGSASGQINLNDTTGSIQLNGSDVLTIDSSGNLTAPNNLTVTGTTTNTGAITSTGGIYLGGTASANLLDDYEEGTWTPTLGGATTDPTCTYAFNDGYYVKVGSLVHIKGGLRCTANSGGSGQVVIRGLPFTIDSHLATTAVESNGSLGYWGGVSTAKSWLGIWAYGGSTNLYMTSTSSTHSVVEAFNCSDTGATFQCRFSISYVTTE